MNYLAPLLFLLSPFIQAAVTSELSGNLEAQSRQVVNQPAARQDLGQDWQQDQFHLIYGNLNGKWQFNRSRLETNFFVRHSYSELYQERFGNPLRPEPALATQIYTFPNTLVVRDIFKLQYQRRENNYFTESVINKFFYEWDNQQYRFTIGRMYVNYGVGEIFNPINPFNQPTGLTFISQIAQGNDGMAVSYFASEHHTISLFLLGDKRINQYQGEIDPTFWIHGEYQFGQQLQVDYVAGEDQQRRKFGGQILYRLSEANIFTQLLYQSNNLQQQPSHSLWDFMLGFDQQLTAKWHVRTEAGYQQANRLLQTGQLGARFLPTEYFVALANQYELHPLLKLTATVVNDFKTGFTYLLARTSFDLGHNSELDLFASSPLIKGHRAQNIGQQIITTDLGLAVRTFF